MFERISLILGNDEARRAASAALIRSLGSRAMPVMLSGVKDVADLVPQPDGRARFAQALKQSDVAIVA